MKIYEAIVIGGGPSGISCAYHLKNHGIDYLLIEQKEMLQTWKHERWDSFYLVTPNWMTNLPGVEHLIPYDNGYMSRSEIEHVLLEYLSYVDPNCIDNTSIKNIVKENQIYRLNTNNGPYYTKNILVATGLFNQPFIPKISKHFPEEIHQIHSMAYYNPEQLLAGGTLVVGAGRSGVQIALEIKEKMPFDCYLAVGSLSPLPLIYRSINGVYWLNRLSGYKSGKNHLPYSHDDLKNQNIANKLNQSMYNCQIAGVNIVGRLVSVERQTLRFKDDLHHTFAKGESYRKKIEVKVNGLMASESFDTPEEVINLELPPIPLKEKGVLELDLVKNNIKNIVWCTGFVPNYEWLTLGVFDSEGKLDIQGASSPRENVFFCGMGLQPDPDTKSSFGVGLFALVESAKRAVDAMIQRMK